MISSTEKIWQKTLEKLQLQMTKAAYDTWMRDTYVVHQEENVYTIGVQNGYAKDWLENRLHDAIINILSSIVGDTVQVTFVVSNKADVQDMEDTSIQQSPHKRDRFSLEFDSQEVTMEKSSLFNGGMRLRGNLKLNNHYTFEQFVVGASNRLAHAAALAVMDAPGIAYNPLFLYGGVGLGKTHLLQGIAHRALANNLRVIYISTETFVNDFINAIRQHETDAFREYYRNTDFLLIDDIQFIAGKESTQEEFFHTFNDIHSAGGQIVITSDRMPKAIPTLEDRLSSRFEWGLQADIQPPNFETRVAILRFKAEIANIQVPNDVIEFIARRARSNIRELEGALNKVVAQVTLNQEPMSQEQAKLALQDLVPCPISITIEQIIKVIVNYYDLSVDDIKSSKRNKKISVPRQIIMYLARTELKLSFPQIGESLGGRDHTTILHGYHKIEDRINYNENTRQDIVRIREALYLVSG
ncbi:MAG: hypothetical protein B6242_13120 [Anaerolineaceae bacterium 4572_78]|nr:MAG: hypothetical protein B6242_13120 [Anaerolineaceae bacterium 4572_78]